MQCYASIALRRLRMPLRVAQRRTEPATHAGWLAGANGESIGNIGMTYNG